MHRFKDENLTLYDFSINILLHCPKCNEKAAIYNCGEIVCDQCGNFKNPNSFELDHLWLSKMYKGELFFAYNYEHLDYLKRYIQAKIRERNNRVFMTMVEKLPQFIKSKKNREGLLKIISQFKNK